MNATGIPSFEELTKRFHQLRGQPGNAPAKPTPYFHDRVRGTFSTTPPPPITATLPPSTLTPTTLVASKIFKWTLGIGVAATLILAISLLTYFQIIPLPYEHLAGLIGIGVSGTAALTSLIIALINKRHPPPTLDTARSSSVTVSREASVHSGAGSIAPTPIEPTLLDQLIPLSELVYKRTLLEIRVPAETLDKITDLVRTCRSNSNDAKLKRRQQAALLAEQEIAHLVFYGRIKRTTPELSQKITDLKKALNNLLDLTKTEFESTITSILQSYQKTRETIPDYASISEIYDTYSTAAHDMTIFINRNQTARLPHLLHAHPTLVTGMALYAAQLSISSTESPEAQATQTAINALVNCRLQEAAPEPASRTAIRLWTHLFQTPWS